MFPSVFDVLRISTALSKAIRYWPNNARSSNSSGPSFLTLFTSGEAGLMSKKLYPAPAPAAVLRPVINENRTLARYQKN
jgi:hypothetical protein